MRPTRPDDLEVSWHEGGHAIGAVLRSVPFSRVTIEPEGNLRGALHYVAPGAVPVEDTIIVALCGPEAEAYAVPEANIRLHYGHHDEQRARLACAVLLMVEPEDERVTQALRPYRLTARKLMAEHQTWLRAVVERLILYGTLTEDEVRQARRKLRPVVRRSA